jgi:hypothetical protein
LGFLEVVGLEVVGLEVVGLDTDGVEGPAEAAETEAAVEEEEDVDGREGGRRAAAAAEGLVGVGLSFTEENAFTSVLLVFPSLMVTLEGASQTVCWDLGS